LSLAPHWKNYANLLDYGVDSTLGMQRTDFGEWANEKRARIDLIQFAMRRYKEIPD
jgi:hypothetical protein